MAQVFPCTKHLGFAAVIQLPFHHHSGRMTRWARSAYQMGCRMAGARHRVSCRWAAAEITKNFSGAEIEGLVKSATSFALNRQVDVADLSKPIDEDNLKVKWHNLKVVLAMPEWCLQSRLSAAHQLRLSFPVFPYSAAVHPPMQSARFGLSMGRHIVEDWAMLCDCSLFGTEGNTDRVHSTPDAQRVASSVVLQVSMQDFQAALSEVKPAFGAVTDTLDAYRLNGIIDWGEGFRHLATTCRTLVEQVQASMEHKIL